MIAIPNSVKHDPDPRDERTVKFFSPDLMKQNPIQS